MDLIDVDDPILSLTPSRAEAFRTAICKRFVFGKWKRGESDFAGRRLRQRPDRILVDQEKYILEELRPLVLERGRASQKDSPLTPAEQAGFRSMVYQLIWVAKETRPEASGAASLLASRLPTATVADASDGIRMVRFLRSTASQTLTVWGHDLDRAALFVASDCGGIGFAAREGAQGAWIAGLADPELAAGLPARVSPLSWRSCRLKRVVNSTVAGEAQTFPAALAEAGWMRVMIRDVRVGDVTLQNWTSIPGPSCPS